MSESEDFSEVRFPLSECSAKHVTVFSDRAEVTRGLTFTPKDKKCYMVVIEGITMLSNVDSIRVKSIPVEENGGGCIIQEVSFDVHVSKGEADQNEAVLNQARKATAKVSAIRSRISRVKEQNEFITKYMSGMLAGHKTTSGDQAPPTVGVNLEQVESLLSFHAKQSSDIDSKLADLQEELRIANEEKNLAEAALNKSRRLFGNSGVKKSRNVAILLSVAKVGKLTLELTYIVTSASWKPSYDIRMDSISDEKSDNTNNSILSTTYFGVVKQNTGEDWNGVSLSLSTASPAAGGTPPLPPTKLARWTRSPGHFSSRLRQGPASIPMQSNMALPMRAMRATSLDADELEMSDSSDSDSDNDDDLGEAVATVKEGSGVASFDIQRRATIASDNREHKVTITMIEFCPKLRHFCTPEIEPVAYIQARLKNTSSFPLLSSKNVAIFIGGSFLTKTSLQHTSPGEDFSVFLGSDPSVKVGHKLIKKTFTKGKARSGMFSSGERSKKLISFHTVVNNTTQKPVLITLVQLLPRSSDDKIVVDLLKPPRNEVPISGEKGLADNISGAGTLKEGCIMQNKVTNNVVFNLNIQPGEKKEIPFSYSVHWPENSDHNKKVEIV